eukprot:gene414-129_t
MSSSLGMTEVNGLPMAGTSSMAAGHIGAHPPGCLQTEHDVYPPAHAAYARELLDHAGAHVQRALYANRLARAQSARMTALANRALRQWKSLADGGANPEVDGSGRLNAGFNGLSAEARADLYGVMPRDPDRMRWNAGSAWSATNEATRDANSAAEFFRSNPKAELAETTPATTGRL